MEEVVALGAFCDLVPSEDPGASTGAQFQVSEFAELSDGSRLTLLAYRGFTSWIGGHSDPWQSLTRESIVAGVLTTVLPDTDDGDEHAYEWLAELLGELGVQVTGRQLRGLPYSVELSRTVEKRLAAGRTSPTGP
jgi:hypothetical protein